jgi:hypothetical protein
MMKVIDERLGFFVQIGAEGTHDRNYFISRITENMHFKMYNCGETVFKRF